MEIERIAATRAADQALAAWAAVVEAIGAEQAATPATVPLNAADEAAPTTPAATHETGRPVPMSEPALPGVDADPSHEAATVQTTWRAPTPPAEVHRGHEATTLATPAAQSDLAVPAALLVPATLTGLQVEPATIWPLPVPGAPPWDQTMRRVDRNEEPPARARHEPRAPEPEQSDEPVAEVPPQLQSAPDDVLDAEDAGAWCEALTAALTAALAARIVPRSLLVAAEQWQRGRCVVIACPQGSDPSGPGWAFVLWPRAAAPDQPLALRGLRVDARLQWHTLPPSAPWCHARVIREHHPRHGRQLVSSEVTPRDTALPCEVQLGPVLARSLRWCEVRVHIAAAQRFWAALGRQWSVHIVVSARPLLAVASGRSA